MVSGVMPPTGSSFKLAGSTARMSAEVARLRRESPATVDALARARATTTTT